MPNTLLRFGFHDFLNAQPLLLPLKRAARQAGMEIVLGAPAELAAKLKAGELDLAMIPSAGYLKEADRYRLAPGLSIASRGAVGTVLLAAKTPLAEVRSLALDNRSITSETLLRVLFGARFHPRIQFHGVVPDPKTMLENYDAALVIGDQAFQIPILWRRNRNFDIYDLSAEWFRRTGKTFVHAVVAALPEAELEQGTLDILQRSKAEGLQSIPEIAKTQAEKHGISKELCEDYLMNKIIYDLGEEELAGLALFRDWCHERGLIERKHEIRFVEPHS
ncbi:MAG: menaquinone biosynthetic enzyme MqnA/MqnD family protein [Nitrospinales bacterium]